MVRVSAVNSTTIHVSWKPPAEKDRNGIIRGYHIHIHEIKDEVKLTTVVKSPLLIKFSTGKEFPE